MYVSIFALILHLIYELQVFGMIIYKRQSAVQLISLSN